MLKSRMYYRKEVLNKWMYQNRAEVLASASGILDEDTLFLQCKRGYAFVSGRWVNCKPIYLVAFSRSKAEAWEAWTHEKGPIK